MKPTIALFAIFALFASALSSEAASTGNKNGPDLLPPVTIPTVDHKPVAAARQSLAQAQSHLTKAQEGVNSLVADLKKQFQGSAKFRAASDRLTSSQTEYERLSTAVIESLGQRDPAYRQARADKEAASQKVQAIKAAGGTSDPEMLVAAKALTDKGSDVTKMEQAAIAADPKASAARQRMTTAAAEVKALLQEFEGSIKQNKDWQKLHGQEDAARDDITRTTAALTSALEKERSEENARQAAQNEQHRRDVENSRRKAAWEEQHNKKNKKNG